MNIFILDNDPCKAARYHCDKHCSKMILEIAQMMSTNLHLNGIHAPYKATHANHPSTVWARESRANFDWLADHANEMGDEKIKRYGKPHKSMEVIKWAIEHVDQMSFPSQGLTKFAVAINADMECRKDPAFNEDNVVDAYRLYYNYDKSYMARWDKLDNTPHWFHSMAHKN
jgi:hypothetical protein